VADIKVTSFADIEPVELEAVWQGIVLAGTVNVLAGPGGSGKSFLGYDLAARVSQGDVMPDGTPGTKPCNVVIVGLEDSPEASAVHRLAAANAALGRVYDASETPSGKPFDLTEDLPWLRELVDQVGGARLVIVDTLSAASPVSLTAVATVRRKLLIPLRDFARDTGAAVLVLHHLTKAGEIAGSRGIVDGAQQILRLTRDDADPRIRSLQVVKSNVVRDDGPALRFTLTGEGKDTSLAWLSADETRGKGADSGQARILMLLQNITTPLTAQEIAAKTALKYTTTRVLLHRLVKAGKVTSPRKNAYIADSSAAAA